MADRSAQLWLEVYDYWPRSEERVAAVTAEALCGEAFDDACGCCLVCYGDECGQGSGRWIIELDDDGVPGETLTRVFGPLFATMAAGRWSGSGEVARLAEANRRRRS